MRELRGELIDVVFLLLSIVDTIGTTAEVQCHTIEATLRNAQRHWTPAIHIDDRARHHRQSSPSVFGGKHDVVKEKDNHRTSHYPD
jgi:hypothetical protein